MTKLVLTAIDPGWSTGQVNVAFANGAPVKDGEERESIHVGVQFRMTDADKPGAKARSKDLLKAAIAALD